MSHSSIPPSKGVARRAGGCCAPTGTSADPANETQIPIDAAKLLQDYLDTFRAGKIPPEAFPIGSPNRPSADPPKAIAPEPKNGS